MPIELPTKSLVRAACVILLLCLPSFPSPKAHGIESESFTYARRKSVYRLFVPDSLSAGNPAPLILLLHGVDENGLTMADPWRALAAKEGIVLVAPDLESQGPDFFIALVDSVRAKLSVDPRRIYLFGNSAGATLALLLSLIDSQYYAATAVHAGTFREDFQAAPQFLERAQRRIPIGMWHGTADERVPLAGARATRDLLAKFEFPVELHEMTGWDHTYLKHSDEVNREMWTFLKQHELDADPASQPYRP